MPSFLYTCTFLITFSGLRRYTYISCYISSEKLKFEVFKTENIVLKNLNEEKHWPSENEKLEAFER